MMQCNIDHINCLNLIWKKLEIHQSLKTHGFLFETNIQQLNLELLIQIVSHRMARALTLTDKDIIKSLGKQIMNDQALA